MNFNGMVTLITGAGSGIGRAAALNFVKHGSKVAILSRSSSELISLKEEIEYADGQVCILTCDISNKEQIKKAYESLVNRFGKLDIVIANAGINGVWAPIDKLSPEDFMKTVSINLLGTYNTLHYAVPYLKHNGGVILITSSINGNRTFATAGSLAYSATKAAQIAMARMLAVELGPFNIRVNSVCPGMISTDSEEHIFHEENEHTIPMVDFPQGKIQLTNDTPGTAQQVSDLMLFLASDKASHITGTEVYIDGGQSLF